MEITIPCLGWSLVVNKDCIQQIETKNLVNYPDNFLAVMPKLNLNLLIKSQHLGFHLIYYKHWVCIFSMYWKDAKMTDTFTSLCKASRKWFKRVGFVRYEFCYCVVIKCHA